MYRLAVKNAFLFIGAMIGAGFATGAELMVFFRASGSLTLLISAAIIGLMSVAFVSFGRIIDRYPRLDKAINIVMVIASIITFITMQAGIEELFADNYAVIGVGLTSAIVIAILSRYSMNFAKILNAIVIPIVVVMIIILAIYARPLMISGKIEPMNAVNYASMNLLLGGYLIAKDSRGMELKHSLIMAIIITIIIGAMMLIMLNLARIRGDCSMPIYAVAIHEGLGGVACGIIYLAIITTIIGAGKVVGSAVNSALASRWGGSIFLILLSIVTYKANFSFMVDTFYPITGYVGVAMCAVTLILLFATFIRDKYEDACNGKQRVVEYSAKGNCVFDHDYYQR